MIAAMKLSALRPLHRADSGAPRRVQGSTYLLELSAGILEKAYLVRTDPRGQSFRWYVVLRWHALAIAIAECYACNDAALVRRLWPFVEASFKHHSNYIVEYRQGVFWRPYVEAYGTNKKQGRRYFDARQPNYVRIRW